MKNQTHQKEQLKLGFVSIHDLMFALITIILIAFAGFRAVGFDRDSPTYAIIIQSIDFSNLNFSDKEPTFYIIVYIAKCLFGDAVRGTFIIYAFLGVTLKMAAIYRHAHVPILSVLFYISSYYILHELTQIRVGVAAAIFLLALPDIINKNLWRYMLKICVATLFHYSAVILVLAYCINVHKKQYLLYLFLPFAAIILYLTDFVKNMMIFLSLDLPQIMPSKVLLYLDLLRQGIHSEINVINLFYVSLIFIYYFLVLNMNRVKEPFDVLQIKLLGWMLFLFYSFASIPVFAFRLSELVGVVLIFILPSFVTIIKQKKVACMLVLVYSLLVGFNLLFIQHILNI